MTFNLVVYHNLDSRFFEFEPGDMLKPTDRLAKVMQLNNLPESLLVDTDRLLNLVFEQLNMDTPTQEWAQVYRSAHCRSLSVGDVLVLGEVAYAVANVGFKEASISTGQIVNYDKPPDFSSMVNNLQAPCPGDTRED